VSAELIPIAPGVVRLTWSPDLQAEGLGPTVEAVRKALADGFGQGHHRVEVLVDPDDELAQRIATFSGLMREGVARRVDEGADRIVYARLVDDTPVEEPMGFRRLLNSFLPRKRAISQMLIRTEDRRVLLCRLTYKNDWDLPGGVVEVGESPQLAVQELLRQPLRPQPGDRRVLRRVRCLGGRPQLFCQLLAGPGPGDQQLDVLADLHAGEPDHALRQVEDADRFAHLEHEDLAALGTDRRLQHQLDSLGGAHEEARHPRVGHRDGTSRRDLPEEGRDDAAAAAQHVPEPHRAVPAAGRVGTQDQLLAEPLGCTHHGLRAHGLVGRDEHQALELHGVRGVEERERPQHVGPVGLRCVRLQDRYVLVRRRVEDDLRAALPEDALEAVPVPDVGEHGRRSRRQLRARVVQVRLVVVQQVEPARVEHRDLAGDLGADRAASAGDQHDAVLEQPADRGQVGDDRLASQQVVDPELAQVVDRHLVVHPLAQGRQYAQRDSGSLGEVGHPSHQRRRCGAQREDDLVDEQLADDALQVLGDSYDGYAVAGPGLLADVVVEQRDRDEIVASRTLHVGDQSGAVLAGADEQDPLRRRCVFAPVQCEQPGLEPHGAGHPAGQQAPHHDDAVGEQVRTVRDVHDREHRTAGERRGEDPLRLVDTRVPPDLAVQPAGDVADHHDPHRQGDVPREPVPVGPGDLPVEAQQQCNDKGQHGHHRIRERQVRVGADLAGCRRQPVPAAARKGRPATACHDDVPPSPSSR
jgi:hypothetical protein